MEGEKKKDSILVLALKVVNGKVDAKFKTKHCTHGDLAMGLAHLELMKKNLVEQIEKSSKINKSENQP